MKRLKLAVIALFTLVTVSNVNAQDENNPWAVGFGVNVVDFYGSTDFTTQLKDLIGNADWNILPSISRITGEKYLEKGFSLQLAGSLNKIETVKTKNDSDALYWAIDAIVKYDLNNLVGDTSQWFDPFVYLGGGYTSFDSNGEGMVNGGLGFNTWFNDNLGLNFQTGTKKGFSDKVKTHYQTTLGLAFRFGGNDTDGDGIYDKDPMKHNDAVKFDTLNYIDVLNRGIKVMDSTAISLCMDNDMDIVVFNMFETGNIKKVVEGNAVGTLVTKPQK